MISDLSVAGRILSSQAEPGSGFTRNGRNGAGDPYFTDGKMVVAVLAPAK